MAVIVNENMSIEQALRMLWREANRELVIEKLKERRYHEKPSVAKHEIKRAKEKTKTRRARYKRWFQNKGYSL